MDQIYLQTYSVREEMEKDFIKAIERIAKIGYSGVEFAGNYGGLSAADLKKLLKDNGLTCISAHIGFDKTEESIDYIAEIGGKYIICPSARRGELWKAPWRRFRNSIAWARRAKGRTQVRLSQPHVRIPHARG